MTVSNTYGHSGQRGGAQFMKEVPSLLLTEFIL